MPSASVTNGISNGVYANGTDPIAIVGMGCRWPGDVRDVSGFWELLKRKQSGYRKFGDHRFELSGFQHPNSDRPGSIATEGGFLLSEDPRLFDHTFFGMTALEVETMAPDQRKLLEVVYEAFENAGVSWDEFSGSRTGVYVGNFSNDHGFIQGRDPDHPRPYASTGSSVSILSNRVNYIFNLQGPSVTLDTACSSSMYALHLAIAAIRNGDCDSAIVAASNTIMDPSTQLMMTKLGVLSATSTCHTFDAAADGYARGEGFVALYLKKANDAAMEGSPIRAVIRGTAVNANGRTGGITHPSKEGQEAVIRKAYENAGNLPLEETTYFECHGTGTPVGDPIEISAIGNVFASVRTPDDPLLIGSVKTNLGHTESCSAIAGIMKCVLAFESGIIPPSIGIQKLNPNIDFSGARVKVLTEVTPWPRDKTKRASINSFGYGGANGHCIIDDVHNIFPNYTKPGLMAVDENGLKDTNSYASTLSGQILPRLVQNQSASTRNIVLLPFSSHNEASLKLNVAALREEISKHSLADVAYTLSARRSRFMQRTVALAKRDNPTEALEQVEEAFNSGAHRPKLGFVFTGQGAQWPAMGKELFNYRVFQKSINFQDQVLTQLPEPPSWSVEDVLRGNVESGRIHDPEVSQTVCTALQIGILDLLWSWQIYPSAVVGHSSGEIAATYAGGRITRAEAIVSAYFRGRAVSLNRLDGLMLAVGIGPEEVATHLIGLEDKIKIAAINSPSSVTLSGDLGDVKDLSAKLTDLNIFNRVLQTGGNAYHSHHMLPLSRIYEQTLSAALEFINGKDLSNGSMRYPPVTWVSSVTPHKNTVDIQILGADYWKSNLISAVRFSEAVAKMVTSGGIDLLVEIGPHAALKSPLQQILKSVGSKLPYLASLKRSEDSQINLLQLAGRLFCHNAELDLVAVNSVDKSGEDSELLYEHGCLAIDLPPYKYAYGPIVYYENRYSRELRGRTILRHDLLGSKLPGGSRIRPQWRNVLRLKDLPWLSDHRLIPHPVFPAAGYIATAIEAASRAYNELSDPLPITGFSLRNFSISNALRIPEDDHGVEIVTTLDQVDSATGKSPAWVRCSISSVSRETGSWTEHCNGLVKVEISSSRAGDKMATCMDSRAVNTKNWYTRFAEIGLGYGSAFQGLSEIQADPAKSLAVAKVSLDTTQGTIVGESDYPLHPASLDAIFQLGLIACHGGQTDRARTAFVPVHIPSFYLKNASHQKGKAVSIAHGELRGLRGAYATMQMVNESGEVVLDIQNMRCVSYSEQAYFSTALEKPFAAPIIRQVWKPDIRTLKTDQANRIFPTPSSNASKVHLFDIFDRICTLMIVEIDEKFGNNTAVSRTSDIHHFLEWCKRRMSDETQWIDEAKSLTGSQRQQLIKRLVEENSEYSDVKISAELFNNMEDIMYGQKTGLDVVVPNGLLTSMYDDGVMMTGAFPQISRVFESIGHSSPNLRILEIGAGTGSATRIIMKALCDKNGIKRYKSYTFTDVSSGFLNTARGSFAEYPDIDFSVLDIEQDPITQGYEQQSYDLIIASECLHATASISKTLDHCRQLVKPGGRIVLVENIRTILGHGVVLGTLAGYWSGICEGRVDSPFLTAEGWDSALKKAGFTGTDIVLDDYPQPYSVAATIVSTAVDTVNITSPADSTKEAVFIHVFDKPVLMDRLISKYNQCGIATKSVHIDEMTNLSPNSRYILYADDGEFLINALATRLYAIQDLIHNCSSMTWITSSGMIKGKNPKAGVVAGLVRTLATENPTSRFLTIDVDPESDIDDINLVRSILEQEAGLQEPIRGETEDQEFVWQDGCLWVSRLAPDAGLASQLRLAETNPKDATMLPFGRHGPVRAAFETPGLLTTLYFKPYEEMWKPLPKDWIQVKVAAVGLNWKDLAVSAGRFDMNSFSSEFSGEVAAVGSAVTELKVGDRVYGMGRGHFGNYVRTPASYCQVLAPSDDYIEMATIPLVYMTAVYAFEHATEIKAGEKVLIQTATGGLGLAAIQLARSKGAEVFATVGNEEKARYLIKHMGVAESRIFSSRDIAAIPKLIKASGGQGFDVVLGTANGDMLYESLKLVAPLGRYIDVGRVDVQNSMMLGLDLFQKSATFSSFDLGVVMDANPNMGHILMKRVHQYFRTGHIAPIPSILPSDVSQLGQVLLGFSKGTHIGKLVITFMDPDSLVRMLPPVPRARFDENAEYVVTGGLGGLGRSVIDWMVKHGARHFLVVSRSGAKTAEAQALVDRLDAQGIHVKTVACDVSKRHEIVRLIEETNAVRRIKGVVHAAVSYEDLSFDKLSADKWNAGLAAKVIGTENLHEATKSLPLNFFVMTTSIESIVSLATQSAYNAANTFQELFARYRRRQGLVASTASFGLITDVGHLSTNMTTVNLMARNKTLGLSEVQFLNNLELAFLNNESPFTGDTEPWAGAKDDPLSGVTVITCMDPAALAAKKRDEEAAGSSGGVVPRWYSDGRVALIMRAFDDALKHADDTSSSSKDSGSNIAATQLRDQYDELIKAGPDHQGQAERFVTGAIVKAVADMLFVDASSIDSSKTVAAYGVDSLIAAELRNWFNNVFRADISLLDLLDTKNNISALATAIVSKALKA